MSDEPFVRHSDRSFSDPVLVLGMDGWIDAGLGAGSAMAHLLASMETEPIATFDGDTFIDYRARRPMVRITDGVTDALSWPEIKLLAGTDRDGHDVLVLVGPEPDMRWVEFVDAVVLLAGQLGVRLSTALGAFPLSVPHTRPVRLAATATSRALADSVGTVPGTIEVPAGVHTAIQEGFGRAGIPAVSLWARVPIYAANFPYPAASAALVEGLATVAGLSFDTADLNAAAAMASSRIDEMIAASEEHSQMVRQLELAADAEAAAPPVLDFSDLPSGDEIAAELERFLRGEGGSTGSGAS
ncbi:MAG TPA: PAC2 family protein [Acidimicrobiales bacterium]|nr:PAC2 family protein [Acidimicrobiales bacterium]